MYLVNGGLEKKKGPALVLRLPMQYRINFMAC
jgi:hypothetical protein